MSTQVTNHKVKEELLRWNRPNGSTEANTFYANFNDGGLLIIQLVYSTMRYSISHS